MLTAQRNGHRIMTPSGLELVCCKPYFAVWSATGMKCPRKMKTGRRPPSDRCNIYLHSYLHYSRKRWINHCYWPFSGEKGLLCCASVAAGNGEKALENASADLPDSPTNIVCSVSSITALATPMAFLILRKLATAPTSIVSLVKGKYALLQNREQES